MYDIPSYTVLHHNMLQMTPSEDPYSLQALERSELARPQES